MILVDSSFGQGANQTTLSNNNPAGLEQAVAAGGTINFSFDGLITLTTGLHVTNSVVLDGTGHNVTISGGSRQLFNVSSNGNLTLNNLTLADGSAPADEFLPAMGGAVESAGTVTIAGCVFSNNIALGVTGDFPYGQGGAIFNNDGLLTVSNSLFVQNSALGGTAESFLVVMGWPADGGAICTEGTAKVVNCAFVSNTAAGGGGGGGGEYSVGPGGAADGGAIYTDGALELINSTFADNTASGGWGGDGTNGVSEGQGGNGANGGDANGGAVCPGYGHVTMVNCTFVSNSAAGGPGGAGGSGGDDGYGGNGGDGGNGSGGAFCNVGDAAVYLTNVTFLDNEVTAGEGGDGGNGTNYGDNWGTNGLTLGDSLDNVVGAYLLVMNSILDCAADGTNAAGAITDAGYNINSDRTLLFTNRASFNGTNPLLGTLGNYGGPTETVPLLPGSPAINAANPLAFPPTDQRGRPRPSGAGPDIGAFEYTFPQMGLAQAAGGGIEFMIDAEVGNLCLTQSSSNLVAWSAIATNTIPPSGSVTITDSIATSGPRFYRTVVPAR